MNPNDMTWSWNVWSLVTYRLTKSRPNIPNRPVSMDPFGLLSLNPWIRLVINWLNLAFFLKLIHQTLPLPLCTTALLVWIHVSWRLLQSWLEWFSKPTCSSTIVSLLFSFSGTCSKRISARSMPTPSSTFIHCLFLILGVGLFTLGLTGQLQILWESFFLLWFGSLSLLTSLVCRWKTHKWYPWILRFRGFLSAASIVGAFYLSTWPNSSSMSMSIQYFVLSVWVGLLVLCARFTDEPPIRSEFMSFFGSHFVFAGFCSPRRVRWPTFPFGLWVLLLCEGALRSVAGYPISVLPETIPDLIFQRLILRSIFFLTGKLGIDIQGAHAFVFVRKAVLPLVMFFLILWSLSSLVVILPHETGLRFRFGVPIQMH